MPRHLPATAPPAVARTLALPLALAGALVVVLAALAAPGPARAGAGLESRSGLYASLGPVAGQLVLPARTGSALAAEGVPRETAGIGMELAVGWAFNPRFELGMRLTGMNADDGDEPRSPMLGQFLVEATTHLRPGKRVNPHLVGGIGGAAIGFGENADEENSLEAAAVQLGAGVELAWTRHWGMVFEYRYTLLDMDRQDVILPASEDDDATGGPARVPATGPIPVAGDAAAHQLGFSWIFRM